MGTDFPEFNANNLELAAVRYRLPVNIVASAYEPDLARMLSALDSASFFVYKDGGAPESGFYERHQKALIQYVRDSGRYRELVPAIPLPDGGVARIFENVGPGGGLRSASFIASGADVPSTCQFDFGGQIQLTGLAWEQSAESLSLRLRWRCLKPPTREYRCFIHILDNSGKVVGQLDHWLMGGNPPVLTWRAGDGALEALDFPPGSSRASGPYRLRLGLFDPPSGERLPATIIAPGAGFSLVDDGTAVLTPVLFRFP